jgi:O-antigen/teichoic acid export membrane protein
VSGDRAIEPRPLGVAIDAQDRERASLTTHAVWILTAKTVGFILAAALPIVLVRRMSQAEFGLYKQVFFIVATAMYVLPLGFGMSAYYFLPRERARQGGVVLNVILFQASMGVLLAVVLLLWPNLLARAFNSAQLTELARPLGIVVVLWTLGTFLETVTLAAQDVKASTGFIVVSQTSKTALLIIAAVTVGTVRALVVAAIVQGVLQVSMMLVYLRARYPRFWRAFDWRLLRAQASYALPLGFSSLILKLQDDLHHLFVSNAFGPATYAIYAIGVFKVPFIGILRESVGSVVLPRINQLENENAQRRILLLVAAAARSLALVYFPAYVFLMVTGPELIRLLFTDRYLASWPIFAISLTVLPFSVLVLDPVTRAHSERYFFVRFRIVLFIALTATLWFASEALGLYGIIAAVVGAHLTGWFIAAVRMARLLEARRRDAALFADVGRIAAAAIGAGLLCAWIRAQLQGAPAWEVLALCAPPFAAVYAIAVGRAGIVTPREVRAQWQAASRLWLVRRPAPGTSQPG